MSIITITNFGDAPVAGEIDLRQAVAQAAVGDTIASADPSNGAFISLSAPIDIAAGKNLTIDFGSGLNSSISGGSLVVEAGATLVLRNVDWVGTVIGANSPDDPADGEGGVAGQDGADGGPGENGGNGTNGAGGGNGEAATTPGQNALGTIQNYGTLSLIDDYIQGVSTAGAGAHGGAGGDGADGGSGGDAGAAVAQNGQAADGLAGGDAGEGRSGGPGGAGSAGGDAVGAIYNASGGILTIQDTFITGSARAGNGGNGGRGGGAGAGGHGGAGSDGVGGGNGGDGGDGGAGGNGGASGVSGNGGLAVGGIWNLGAIDVIGAAILTGDTAVAGAGGVSGQTQGGAGGFFGYGGLGFNDGANGDQGAPGVAGAVGANGVDGFAAPDYLNNGALLGSLTVNGAMVSIANTLKNPAPPVVVDGTGSFAASVTWRTTYSSAIYGAPGPSTGSVGWKIVPGASGPALSDFETLSGNGSNRVLSSATSGVLNFDANTGIFTSVIGVTFAPQVNEPAKESFSIELYDPSTGTVLGSADSVTVDFVNPLATKPILAITNGALGDSLTQTITGTIDVADAGLSISIYDGATLLGTTSADPAGLWSAAVTLSGAAPDALSAQATDGAGDTGVSNAAYLALAGGETIVFADPSGDVATLYNSGGLWDNVFGSDGQINLTNARAKIVGGGDTTFEIGSGDQVKIFSTGDQFDKVFGSASVGYVVSADASFIGGGNSIRTSGAGNRLKLLATGADMDKVFGPNVNASVANAEASFIGGGDVIRTSGAGDVVKLFATFGAFDKVYGANLTAYLINAQASFTQGGDTIHLLNGQNDTVKLFATGANADSVIGSDSTIDVIGAETKIIGSNDHVALFDKDTVSLVGGGFHLSFQPAIGNDTINGFGASDTMQFSKQDFADFAALQSHVSQSGANAAIALDAHDTVTLTDVAATSLSASQFKFV